MTAMRSEQQVEAALKSYEDVDSWKTIIFLYNAGTRRDFHAKLARQCSAADR